MAEEQLVVPYKKKRRYSSYQGEISPAVENLVARVKADLVFSEIAGLEVSV